LLSLPSASPHGFTQAPASHPSGSSSPEFCDHGSRAKRFAQSIGLSFSGAALVGVLLGSPTLAVTLIAMLLVAASLEAFVGLCLGCIAFRWLMRAGVIPSTVCAACNDITAHLAARSAALAQQ
jgi:Domain of unknown function (DUF4395)